jgi:hypothetical protein
MIPLIIAGAAALGGAITNAVTANNAANKLKAGEAQARGDIENYANKAANYQQPYYSLGTQNAQNLSNMVNSGQFSVNPYSYTDTQQAPQTYQNQAFNFQQDPGYQFQMQQGLAGVQNSAAAGGGLLSGATLKALQRYGQGLAGTSYQNAFNRNIATNQQGLAQNQNAYNQYNTNRNFGAENSMNQYTTQNQQANQRYNQMSNLANMGIGAANNLTGLYNNLGQAIGNTDIGQASANAWGTTGVGNAINSGLNTIGNMASYYAMQNQTPNPSQVAQQRFNKIYGQG